MIHQKHLYLLLDLNADTNPHSGGALVDHLRGTHDLLQEWGNDQAVCIGWLFHSISWPPASPTGGCAWKRSSP